MNSVQRITQLERQLAEIKKENQALRGMVEQLESRQQLLRVMGDTMPAYATYLDAETLTYRYLNRAVANAIGREPDELIGAHLAEVLGPENFQFAKPYIDQALKGIPASYENTFTLANGSRRVQVTYTPDVMDNGQVKGIIVLAFDITELRLAQKALQESEVLHRSLFESSPTPIALQDFSKCKSRLDQLTSQGIGDLRAYLESHPDEVNQLAKQISFTYSNQAAIDIYKTQLPGDRFTGINQVLLKQDQKHFIDQLVAFACGERVYKGEARNLDAEGNHIEVMLHKAVMPGHEDDLAQVLVTIIDLTALKKAQRDREQLSRQLQQAQKMEAIGTLAGGIAHDFNNILAVIMGYSELILSTPEDVKGNMRNVMQILKASGRARSLVRQILTFSRKVQSDLESLDLNTEVANAVSILERTLPKMIQLETRLAPDLPAINADATQIEQVILNLGANAADAMPDGGRISIQTSETTLSDQAFLKQIELEAGRYLLLKFSDNGCGMDQRILQQIFDPFFTTKEIGKGTGLGLSTAFGIIKSHGGHITCESTLQAGTCFTIYLPAGEAA